jgi:hypothetical protein
MRQFIVGLACDRLVIGAVLAFALPCTAVAQNPAKPPKAMKESTGDRPVVQPLFDSDTPLAITFTVNIARLRHDRTAKGPWRAATLSYDGAGKKVEVPVGARTRGIWRLKNCEFPPARLAIKGKTSKGTIFHGLEKPKLVSYCRDNDEYEQYLLQEFQLYRIYRLLTPASHQVRLVRMTYADSGSGRQHAVRWAFIAEDPGQLARRMGGIIIKTEGGGPDDFDPESIAIAYVFQYMIGNTDFSFNRLHNTEIVASGEGKLVPIAYDFDFAGAVNARYATADPRLNLHSVRERRYRGYCSLSEHYPKVFALFRAKRDAIYGLYQDDIGKLLSPRVVKETLSYFDEFYDTINDPGRAERSIIRDCVDRS